MRICGIDPGLRNTGWGIIALEGNRLVWVADGVIRPDPSASDASRLGHIRAELAKTLALHDPDTAVIEEIFVSRNAASALKLGMARGAAMIALHDHGLHVEEISARRVKQNVTGSGRAQKDQVTAMVRRLLGIEPTNTDSADALAIAIAATNQDSLSVSAGGAAENGGNSAETGGASGLQAAIARALEKEQTR